jgi:hypothetical protein
MTTGSSSDIVSRVKGLIPNKWFKWTAPYRDAILGGIADLASWSYGLIGYARAQTRIGTAYGIWLDIISLDFLGRTLLRGKIQDPTYRALIKATILQERVTRAGMIAAITNLCGVQPGNVQASATATFSGQPANNDSISFGDATGNTTTVTFKTSGATGNQVNIGGTLAVTLASLATLVNNSADTNLYKWTLTVNGSVVTGSANVNVLAGSLANNFLTWSQASSVITLSSLSLINGVTSAATIFEPWNTFDTGAYSGSSLIAGSQKYGSFGYGAGKGGWGSMQLPCQAFVKVTRTTNSGVPLVGGYGGNVAGYGVGSIEYVGTYTALIGVTNQDILNMINRTKPTGMTCWAAID